MLADGEKNTFMLLKKMQKGILCQLKYIISEY